MAVLGTISNADTALLSVLEVLEEIQDIISSELVPNSFIMLCFRQHLCRGSQHP